MRREFANATAQSRPSALANGENAWFFGRGFSRRLYNARIRHLFLDVDENGFCRFFIGNVVRHDR